MNKLQVIILLGIWIAIVPFLGFPLSWKKILILLSGLVVGFLAYTINRKENPFTLLSHTEHNPHATTPAADSWEEQ